MCLAGAGVSQDFRLATHLYEVVAEQGHVQAQLNLGELYAKGRGILRDPVLALKWLGLAAETAHVWAVEATDDLARSLTQEELEAARRLIASWRSKWRNARRSGQLAWECVAPNFSLIAGVCIDWFGIGDGFWLGRQPKYLIAVELRIVF